MKFLNLNPWRGLKDLPHDMWALFITTLINRSGTMVIPFLTLYLTIKISVTPAEAGTVLMVYGLGAFISSPLLGKLSDKFGALKLMQFSLFGTSVMFVVFSFAENYYLILVLAVLLAIINEAFRPANLSMVTEIVAPSQRRMAFVLNRLAINIGMSIGPVIGGFLTTIDYHLLFYANAVTSTAAGVYLLSVKFDISVIKPEIQSTVPTVKKTIFHDRSFLFFLFGIVPVNLAFFQILGTLPLYIVNDLQYTTFVYGFLLAINTVLIIIAEVPLNNMMANISYRNSLITGALFTAVGFGAIAFARDTLPLVVTIIIWTCGEMIFFPVSAAYASEIAPKSRRGEYMGYYQMTFNFAFSAGPWLGTVIYQNYGAFTVWIWTFIFGLISAGLMFFIKNIKIPVKEIPTLT